MFLNPPAQQAFIDINGCLAIVQAGALAQGLAVDGQLFATDALEHDEETPPEGTLRALGA